MKVERVKLFKVVDGKLRLVDYGLAGLADVYANQGYIVEHC